MSTRRRVRIDRAWGPAAVGIGVAGAGWATASAPLAIAGVLLALVALLAWAWGRWCLASVSYVRTLRHSRAAFGERLTVDVEVVNDKLLPLAWLHVRDVVPAGLPVEGATVVSEGWHDTLQLVLAMLPYQRVRRQITVVCTDRGLHRFGPATMRSGSPLGTHERRRDVRDEATLLVYPKVVPLTTTPIVSHVPIGERRMRRSVAVDPSRVVGVRPYVNGDRVRDIDWRATARSSDILVRLHEPAAMPSMALFVDLLPPRGATRRVGVEMTELVTSVAASVASQLLADGVPTGLFTSGTSRGSPIAVPPARDPGTARVMLELLAQVSPAGGVPIAEALVRTGQRMGVSVLVIATDFPAPTVAALADVGRRTAVGALWVAGGRAAAPPPAAVVDVAWVLAFEEGWRDWSMANVVPYRGSDKALSRPARSR